MGIAHPVSMEGKYDAGGGDASRQELREPNTSAYSMAGKR